MTRFLVALIVGLLFATLIENASARCRPFRPIAKAGWRVTHPFAPPAAAPWRQ